MTQTFTMARANGRLPFLLWARPSPVGEHVLVWLPAGMAVKDLERVTGELAAACWATDARILPSKRRAFLAAAAVGGALAPVGPDDARE